MASGTDSSTMIRVAVDAMGGDNAPEEIVTGAVQAAQAGIAILLVGMPERVQPILDQHNAAGLPIRLIPSEDAIEETQQPALALRRNPRASIGVATALVQRGDADAVVSMGPTGAAMVAAVQLLGMMDGIERPILGGPFLGFAPQTTLLDLGVNIDSKPAQFLDFAAIGAVFCRKYLEIPNPTVALLNVGGEEGKGNRQMKDAYFLLQNSGFNFIGNIEGHEYFNGKANVVIVDGFVGNILLKYSEGLGEALVRYLSDRLDGKVDAETMSDLSRDMMSKMSALDSFGGPMWGINGVSIVGHGRGRAQQVQAAIETARMIVRRDVIPAIREELARVRGGEHN